MDNISAENKKNKHFETKSVTSKIEAASNVRNQDDRHLAHLLHREDDMETSQECEINNIKPYC